MAAAVLAAGALPAEVRALVAAKAEGNPFYVEELVKSLEESGALRRAAGRLELTGPVSEVRRAWLHPGRDCRAHRPPRRGAQANAPARRGDRA